MDTQEHEYELGTLEEDILDRDESQARQSGSRGDERRWMILGGAGTLALLAAIVAAVSLGGAGESHELSASLRGPVRDLSALSAHLQTTQQTTQSTVSSTDTAEKAPERAPKARIARRLAEPAQPTPVAPSLPAGKPATTATTAATLAATTTATTTTTLAAQVDDTAAGSFAGLPTVSNVDETAATDEIPDDEAAAPAEVIPTNFEQDDDPFAEDPSKPDDAPAESADGDVADDDSDEEVEEATAPAPAEADRTAEDVVAAETAAPPTPA